MKLTPIKIVVGAVVLLVLLLLLMSSGHKTVQREPTSNAVGDSASGDTNNEVLHELTAKYQEVIAQNQKLGAAIHAMKQPASHSVSLNPQQEAALHHLQQAQAQTQAMLKNIQDNLDKQKSGAEYPVDGDGSSSGHHVITVVTDLTHSSPLPENGETAEAGSAKEAQSGPPLDAAQSESHTVPYYTIPALSNLGDTSLMTALIGEVPNGSTFEQPPFPFQAIIGRKQLLSANGFHLPSNVSGMKISGYSVGVGSFMQGLACVRSYITQVLFQFNDGHFTVVGHANTGNDVNPSDALGYLSDPYGNPCMKGTYITNADRVLAALTGIGMVSGVSQGLAQAQTSTMTGFNGTSTVFNGSAGKYAMGYGMSSSADKATDYMLDRLKGTFDVVYIPASIKGVPTKVVANFTKTVPIDLDKQGRQVRYASHTDSAQRGLD